MATTKKKKAYIVSFSIAVRVIAESEDEAQTAGIEKVLSNPENYVLRDNIDEVEMDKEIPYGSLLKDLKS